MEGFSCTIFAYGQTGTGKTHTMEGGPRNSADGANLSAAAGVIPRSIKRIFDNIGRRARLQSTLPPSPPPVHPTPSSPLSPPLYTLLPIRWPPSSLLLT